MHSGIYKQIHTNIRNRNSRKNAKPNQITQIMRTQTDKIKNRFRSWYSNIKYCPTARNSSIWTLLPISLFSFAFFMILSQIMDRTLQTALLLPGISLLSCSLLYFYPATVKNIVMRIQWVIENIRYVTLREKISKFSLKIRRKLDNSIDKNKLKVSFIVSFFIAVQISTIIIETNGAKIFDAQRGSPLVVNNLISATNPGFNTDGSAHGFFSDEVSPANWTLVDDYYIKEFYAENENYIVTEVKNAPFSQFTVCNSDGEEKNYYPSEGLSQYSYMGPINATSKPATIKIAAENATFFESVAVSPLLIDSGILEISTAENEQDILNDFTNELPDPTATQNDDIHWLDFYAHGKISLLLHPVNFTVNSLFVAIDDRKILNLHPWDGDGNEIYSKYHDENQWGSVPAVTAEFYEENYENGNFIRYDIDLKQLNSSYDSISLYSDANINFTGLHKLGIAVNGEQYEDLENGVLDYVIIARDDFDGDGLGDVDEVNVYNTLPNMPTSYGYYTVEPEADSKQYFGDWGFAEFEFQYFGDESPLYIDIVHGDFRNIYIDGELILEETISSSGKFWQLGPFSDIQTGFHKITYEYNTSSFESIDDITFIIDYQQIKPLLIWENARKSDNFIDSDDDGLPDVQDNSPNGYVQFDNQKIQRLILQTETDADTEIIIQAQRPKLDYYELSHREGIFYEWNGEIVEIEPVIRLLGNVKSAQTSADQILTGRSIDWKFPASRIVCETIDEIDKLQTYWGNGEPKAIQLFNLADNSNLPDFEDSIPIDWDSDGLPEPDSLDSLTDLEPGDIYATYGDLSWINQSRLDQYYYDFLSNILKRESQIIPGTVLNNTVEFSINVPKNHVSKTNDQILDLCFEVLWQVNSMNIAPDTITQREQCDYDRLTHNVINFISEIDHDAKTITVTKNLDIVRYPHVRPYGGPHTHLLEMR